MFKEDNFIESKDDLINDLENTPDLGNYEEEVDFEEINNNNNDNNLNDNSEDNDAGGEKGDSYSNPIAGIFANLNAVALPFITEKILNYFNRESKLLNVNNEIKEELKRNYEVLLSSEFIDSLSPKERALLSIVLINFSFIGTAFILSSEKKEVKNVQNKNVNNNDYFENSYNDFEKSEVDNLDYSFNELNTNNKKRRGRPRKNKDIIEI